MHRLLSLSLFGLLVAGGSLKAAQAPSNNFNRLFMSDVPKAFRDKATAFNDRNDNFMGVGVVSDSKWFVMTTQSYAALGVSPRFLKLLTTARVAALGSDDAWVVLAKTGPAHSDRGVPSEMLDTVRRVSKGFPRQTIVSMALMGSDWIIVVKSTDPKGGSKPQWSLYGALSGSRIERMRELELEGSDKGVVVAAALDGQGTCYLQTLGGKVFSMGKDDADPKTIPIPEGEAVFLGAGPKGPIVQYRSREKPISPVNVPVKAPVAQTPLSQPSVPEKGADYYLGEFCRLLAIVELKSQSQTDEPVQRATASYSRSDGLLTLRLFTSSNATQSKLVLYDIRMNEISRESFFDASEGGDGYEGRFHLRLQKSLKPKGGGKGVKDISFTVDTVEHGGKLQAALQRALALIPNKPH